MGLFARRIIGNTGIIQKDTPPENTNTVWLDTSGVTPMLKTYNQNTGVWVASTSTGGGTGLTLFREEGNSLIPVIPDAIKLGSPNNPIQDLFLGQNSLYVNGNKVLSEESTTLNVSTDIDQHLSVYTQGLGTTRLASGKEVILYSGDDINIQALGDVSTISKGMVSFTTDADGQDIVFETKSTLGNINFKTKHQANFDSPDINFTSTPKVNGKNVITNQYDLDNDGIVDKSKTLNDGTNIITIADIQNIISNLTNKANLTGGKVPLSELPDLMGISIYVKTSIAERDVLTNLRIGDICYITNGDSYIWDGIKWETMTTKDWANINLDWNNIANKPTTYAPSPHAHLATDITQSSTHQFVTDAERTAITHANRIQINKIGEDGVGNPTYDGNRLAKHNELPPAYIHPTTHPANIITVDTTNFNNNLTPAEDTVQKALDKLDDLISSGTSGGASINDTTPSTTTVYSSQKTQTELNNVNTKVGTLSSLPTTNKTDLVQAITEVFIKSNDFKQKVVDVIGSPLQTTQDSTTMKNQIQILKDHLASYLSNKYIVANSTTETLKQLIDKVDTINQTLSSQVQSTKLNITAPYTKTFQLSSAIPILDLCAGLIEYVAGASGITKYNIDFNNGDSVNFQSNPDIIFDGKMKPRNNFEYTLTNLGELGTGIQYESDWINIDDYKNIDVVEVDTDNLKTIVKATKPVIIALPLGFSDISGIYKVTSIECVGTASGQGKNLYALSFDGGLTYGAYNATTLTWDAIDVNNVTDFLAKGMNSTVMTGLTSTQIESFRNGGTSFMCAYLQEQQNITDIVENDRLTLKVELLGSDNIANKNKYNMTYDPTTGIISYEILVSGTYTFNYVDIV